MKPLIIGTLLFLIWSSLATWYYICHVNNYCKGQEAADEITAVESDPSAGPGTAIEEKSLALPSDISVHFAYNSDKFSPGESIKNFTEECKAYLEKNQDALVMITGHTCSIGTSVYNVDLGMRRALAVGDYFSTMGLQENRIRTSSKGEDEPVADNNTNAGREKNRRSEITVKN